MAVRCPDCKREFDVTLFEFGREIVCGCGRKLSLSHEEVFGRLEDICRRYELSLEEEKIDEIKRSSERIAFLIVSSDYPKPDIELEKAKLKELIEKLFPEKAHLYDLIYESRFKRLWEQFREGEA
jgi:hypothetical protein